ncbi:MAG: hypothetical protein ABFC96_08775, partial [Thermoguttaceae bacterium]
MRFYLGLALAAMFGVAASVQAAPLNPKQVSAAAKWVAQVDFDAAHDSVVVKNAREQFLKKNPNIEIILAGVR